MPPSTRIFSRQCSLILRVISLWSITRTKNFKRLTFSNDLPPPSNTRPILRRIRRQGMTTDAPSTSSSIESERTKHFQPSATIMLLLKSSETILYTCKIMLGPKLNGILFRLVLPPTSIHSIIPQSVLQLSSLQRSSSVQTFECLQ